MKIFFIISFLPVLVLATTSRAESGNGGVLQSSGAAENKKYVSVGPAPEDVSGPANFAEREVWRSGVAGTLAMWRQLAVNALPSNEPLRDPKAKKPAGPAK